MADNLAVTPGTGATVGADLISTVLYQRVKLIYGDDGVNSGDVSTANPFPCNVNMIGGAAFALGQQLAAASLPVVLTAAQLTTLTPLTTLPTVTTVGAVTAITNALPAGTNLLGKVSIDQTTLGTTNRVYINTSPKITAAGATMTRVADTNTYTGGDFVANNTTAASCTISNSGFTIAAARGNDVPGRLYKCILKSSNTSTSNAIFKVHIFNVDPLTAAPANGDNGAYNPANKANYLGSFDVTLSKIFGDGMVGSGFPDLGNYIDFTPVSGTANLYAILEVRAAYVPISAEVFTLTLVTE